jgi:hypothetical protein
LLVPAKVLSAGVAEPSKKLKVFILAGQSNMEGTMTEEQKREFMQRYEAELISPAEVALWKLGASNAGYHYLGCAKTFALMGKAFAEANLKMLQSQHPY